MSYRTVLPVLHSEGFHSATFGILEQIINEATRIRFRNDFQRGRWFGDMQELEDMGAWIGQRN